MTTRAELRLLEEKKKALLERQERFKEGLPFLYGHKWYAWQRQFFKSTSPMRLMTCANQVGKSVTHIWDKANRATNFKLWETLWPGRKPDLFWFWMTDEQTIDREVRLKWKRWLPQGDFQKSTQYGWKLDANKKEEEVKGIIFNSGVYLQFLAYAKSTINVQSATVWDQGVDEEMPVKFWDEAYQRTSSTGDYFSAAFTATLNQLMWWRAMEGEGSSEMFPDAFKLQVSKYDCMFFDDGSPGLYTKEQIDKQAAACSTDSQRKRRIFGGFAPESGLKYHKFDPSRHFVEPRDIPSSWFRYSAVDVGSGDSQLRAKKQGSRKNHPAAFYFVAVRPDMRLGYVYKGRRLDNEQTTAGDVYSAYVVERGSDQMTVEKYDYHSKDFQIISDRNGESFVEADKSHARGEEVVNTLLDNDMLFFFDTPEIRKIGEEMLTLMKDTDKRVAVDDGADCVRYAVVDIPWDWTLIQGKAPDGAEPKKKKPLTEEERLAEEWRQRGLSDEDSPREDWGFDEEISFWNDLGGS